MFDNLCSVPLPSDLFAQAIHPTEPLVTVGLSSGHVQTLRLPAFDQSQSNGAVQAKPRSRRGSDGTDVIDTAWSTRRHKGSCRCVAYSVDGIQLYSAGADGIVKAAETETGKVTGKIAIPRGASGSRDLVDAPTALHALSPQTLLLSTDSGALHLYDLRDPAPSAPVIDSKTAFTNVKPSQTYHPHADYISSLCPIPPSSTSTSGYSKQWLSTGGTTLALTDLRRGVLAKSEDQEELLLSCLYVTGLPTRKGSTSTGEKAIVGGGDGVITLWEKGQWDDQDERITVSREKETLDSMAHIPDGVGGLGKKIAVGQGDGLIRFVRLGMNRVIGEISHDEVEGVSELAFDVAGRMISGGGQVLKVWQESIEVTEEEEEDDDDDEEAEQSNSATKRAASNSDGSSSDDDSGESEDDEPSRKRRKKGKRGQGASTSMFGGSKTPFSFSGLD